MPKPDNPIFNSRCWNLQCSGQTTLLIVFDLPLISNYQTASIRGAWPNISADTSARRLIALKKAEIYCLPTLQSCSQSFLNNCTIHSTEKRALSRRLAHRHNHKGADSVQPLKNWLAFYLRAVLYGVIRALIGENCPLKEPPSISLAGLVERTVNIQEEHTYLDTFANTEIDQSIK